MILKLDKLHKSYQLAEQIIEVLKGFSLDLEQSEFVGVSGPSGCGKSTLLNIIGLCEYPSTGKVILDGELINYQDNGHLTLLRRAKIGYVFQYFHLLETLTAYENIRLSLYLNNKENQQQRVEELLDFVGLLHRRNHYPHQLSGGEMQRVAICRALAHQPKLIIADEPTGNLDSVSSTAVLELLNLARKNNSAIIMASHSEQALQSCSRIIKMAK